MTRFEKEREMLRDNPSQQPIALVLAANEKYIPFCLSTVASAVEKNPGTLLEIFILTVGFSDEQTKLIYSWAKEKAISISIVPIGASLFENLPTPEHISLDAYSRLLAPELLPQLDKFIYLDCDLVVTASLQDLINVDLSGFALGAVRQRNSDMQASVVARFDVCDDILYINSGVLLVNAKMWRKKGVTAGILNWMSLHSDQLQMGDQEALIVYLEKQIFELDPKWNVEARHYMERLMGMRLELDLIAALKSPAIIHYTGAVKPWSERGYVPRRAEYTQHLINLPSGLREVNAKVYNSLVDYTKMACAVIRFWLGSLKRSLRLSK